MSLPVHPRAILLLAFAPTVWATPPPGEPLDLGDFSLAELMEIEVTVASRAPQKLSEVPAAVYVITGEEIRRSGHSSIMEVLRMVPGFYVSHWENKNWDITSRGFGNGLSLTSLAYLNQLLVMVDGVELYTPLFAGMWWGIQDIDLADIDRIEVIRGPGGVVWGANAVHGVVNIITKHSRDTQGTQVNLWSGNDDRHAAVRWGGPLGESGHFRVWSKHSEYDNPHDPYAGYDQEWNIQSGGFRADWVNEDGRTFNFWGRGYTSEFDVIGFDLDTFEPYSAVDEKVGGQLGFQTTHPSSGETWHLWASTDRQDLPTLADISIDVFDFGYQREFEATDDHHLSWGASLRVIRSDLSGDDPFWLDFDPQRQTQAIPRVFAVDTIDLVEDEWKLILGLQAEDNEFTGVELQPSARLQWIGQDDWTVWTSVSRAVRTPSLEEVSLTDQSVYVGDPNFDSESLLAYELGVRKILSESALVDLSLFYNDYDELHYGVLDEDTGQRILTNDSHGRAYGAELALDYQATDDLEFRGAYSYMSGHFLRDSDSTEIGTDEYSGKHVANLRMRYDLGEHWELDLAAYGVQGLGQDFEVAEYWRGDVRIGWNPSDELKLSLGAQDYGEPTRSELDGFDNQRRSIFFALNWTP